MAEQIQSMLNDLQDKFQSSFTLQQPQGNIHQQQNPQKQPIKLFDEHQNQQYHKHQSQLQTVYDQNTQVNYHHQVTEDDDLKEQFLRQIKQINEELSSQINTPKKIIQQFDSNQIENMQYMQMQQSRSNIDHHHFQLEQQDYSHKYHRYNSQIPADQQNVQEFSYKELTLKLQKALQKISSQKKISSKLGTNTMYERFQQYEKRKNKQIQKLRQQKQEQQINSVRDRPLINSNSRSMFSGMKQQPLFQRYDKIIQHKKKKQLQYQAIRKERLEKQYETYLQQHNKHMQKVAEKYQKTGVRSNQEYFDEMSRWLTKKQENIKNQKLQKDQRQKQQLVFKPQINKKSQKIMKKSDRVPIYERQVKITVVKDQHCTFKPKINKVNAHKKFGYC